MQPMTFFIGSVADVSQTKAWTVIAWVVGLYLAGVLITAIIRLHRRVAMTDWVPWRYTHHFSGADNCKPELFDKGKEIPEGPTLLIIGRLRRQGLFAGVVDVLTCGLFRYRDIVLVRNQTKLKLYFKNVSRGGLALKGGRGKFYIKYPSDYKQPSRHWDITLPALAPSGEPGDSCEAVCRDFFAPEVPGSHQLLIDSEKQLIITPEPTGLRTAGPYGLAGRELRIPPPASVWTYSFQVYSVYEERVFLVAAVALLISVLSLLLATL
jgi:hypothetical protein